MYLHFGSWRHLTVFTTVWRAYHARGVFVQRMYSDDTRQRGHMISSDVLYINVLLNVRIYEEWKFVCINVSLIYPDGFCLVQYGRQKFYTFIPFAGLVYSLFSSLSYTNRLFRQAYQVSFDIFDGFYLKINFVNKNLIQDSIWPLSF